MRKYLLLGILFTACFAGFFSYALLKDNIKIASILGVSPLAVSFECPQKSYDISEDGTLKFCLNKSESENRCEIAIKNQAPLPQTNRISFDYRLSEDIYSDEHFFIIMQIHGLPDKGEPWRCPPLSVDIFAQSLNIYNRWDINPMTYIDGNTCVRPGNTIQSRTLINRKQKHKDMWHKLAFKMDISHTDNGKIVLQADDDAPETFYGPNTYNDARMPYLKLGVYKPNPWSENQNKICAEFKNIQLSAD